MVAIFLSGRLQTLKHLKYKLKTLTVSVKFSVATRMKQSIEAVFGSRKYKIYSVVVLVAKL